MRWVSKHPPIYVWKDDEWFNETSKKTYKPDLVKRGWVSGEEIVEFTKKTKVFNGS